MEKEKKLLRFLQEQDDWLTTDVLANLCGVSTRTIRNYVATINLEQPIIISSSMGYRMNKSLQLPINSEDVSLETIEDRIRYIIGKLLQETKTLDRYALCEEMYISTSTLKNDLSKVKERLNEFDLYLHQKGDNLWCEGLEKNRRKMVSAMLYQESNSQFMNDDLIMNSFLEIPVLIIKEHLQDIFHQFHYFTNDYNFSNLLLHLCISIDRIQNGCSIVTDYQIFNEQSVEYKIAKKIATMIEETCQCQCNFEEINEIALLILSRSTHVDPTEFSNKSYNNVVKDHERNFIQQVLQKVNDTYYVDLNNEHFLPRFSLHIHNLFIRTHTRYLAKNNLTREMKMNFPLIYDISVFIANLIEEYTGAKINDDEIAYIALHIGCSIDESTYENNKIHTVVLCPQYYDLNNRLIQKINSYFQKDLLITQLITQEDELANMHCQLLLSTYRPQCQLQQPSIMIHPLLTKKDISAIDKFIKEEQSSLKNNTLKQHLKKIFPESLFLMDRNFKNKDTALLFMSDLLMKEGVVDKGFYQEIIERESVSSTAFDHFAIPHSLKMNAFETCVCTSIHHRPIKWNEHQVNFIFMITVNHMERKIFKDIFSSLTDILIDPNQLSKLHKATSYASFIDILYSLL